MNKFIKTSVVATMLLSTSLMATTEFNKNFKATIQKTSGIAIEVKSVDIMKDTQVSLVVAQSPDNRQFPVFATSDGRNILGFSQVFYETLHNSVST